MIYAPLSYLLTQASIKTGNKFMDFSDYIWQYFSYTGRSTGAYNIFYQGGPIDHRTHDPGTRYQLSAESQCNVVCTTGMALTHFRMLFHKCLNKDACIVPEKALLIILDSKSDVCMGNNGKDAKHTRQISRRVHSVRNG